MWSRKARVVETFEPAVKVVEKEIVHTHVKPHRHHFRKTAYIATAPVFRNVVEPQIQKRVDVDEGAVNSADAVYTKHVTVQRNPTFFQDVFNIPISILKSVSNLVSNTAGNTNISVQKSASIHSELDSPKYDQSSIKSSAAHVSVETPSAAKFFDDIIAIPIDALAAVNKFLDNNVPAKKNVQVINGEAVATRIRGPGKRRANKQVVVVQDDVQTEPAL